MSVSGQAGLDREGRIPRLTPGLVALTAGATGAAFAVRALASAEDSPAIPLLLLMIMWSPVIAFVGAVALVRPSVARLAMGPGLSLTDRAELAELAGRRSGLAVWVPVAGAATVAVLLVAAASWADVHDRAAELLPVVGSPTWPSVPGIVLPGSILGLAITSAWLTRDRPAVATVVLGALTTLLGVGLGVALAGATLPLVGVGAGWVPRAGSPVVVDQAVVIPWTALTAVLVAVPLGAVVLAESTRRLVGRAPTR